MTSDLIFLAHSSIKWQFVSHCQHNEFIFRQDFFSIIYLA